MAEAGRTARRTRRRASRALHQAVPLWMVVSVVVLAGVLVVGVLVATPGGRDGTAGAEPTSGGASVPSTSCIDVLARADAFVDAGEGNAEMLVAVDPETGDWAVQLSPEEEACGLRVREVIDRLSVPAAAPPAQSSSLP